MPTTVTYICDPTGLTPGSQTSIHAIVDLLAALPLNWVSEDKAYEILVKGTQVLFNDYVLGPDTPGYEFVTDATHNLTIKAHPGHDHRGRFKLWKPTLITEGFGNGLIIGLPYTRLEGMIIDVQNAFGGFGTRDAVVLTNYTSDAGPVFIDRCIFRIWSDTNLPVNVVDLNKGSGHKITNCAFYACDSAGNMVRMIRAPETPGNNVSVYNCTFINLSTDVGADACMISAVGGDAITQNNYFGALDSDLEVYVGNVTKGANDATYNAEAVTVGLRNLAPDTTLFENVTFEPFDASVGDQMDLHIKSGCALHNTGGVLAEITTDYEGQTRSGTLDIGADEFGLAPAPTPTVDTFVIDPVNGPIETMTGDTFTITDLYGYLTDLGYDFDLVGANKILEVQVKGRITPVGTSALVVNSWAESGFFTNEYNYVVLKPFLGYEHEGVYDEEKALLDATDNTPAIDIRAQYTRIERGFVINAICVPAGAPHGNGGFEGGIVFVAGTDSHTTVDGILIKITPSTDTPVKVFRLPSGNGSVVKNCLAYMGASVNSNFIFVDGPAGATEVPVGVIEVYNNTAVNLSSSSHANSKFIKSNSVNNVFYGHVICENNYFGALVGSNIEVYVTSTDGLITKGAGDATYNAEAVTVGLRNIAPTTDIFKNVTFATADFHLKKKNTVLNAVGVTLSGVPADYEGQARTIPYDVGADEFHAAPSFPFMSAL